MTSKPPSSGAWVKASYGAVGVAVVLFVFELLTLRPGARTSQRDTEAGPGESDASTAQ